MGTTRLELLKFSSNDRSKGAVSLGPRAYVALKDNYKERVADGHLRTVISTEAANYEEFCGQMVELRRELETIEKQAKKFFEEDKKDWAVLAKKGK